MKLIQSPEKLPLTNWKSLFLAGGISNCENWQQELIEYLSDVDVTIVNPRREGDLATDGTEAAIQIEWEFNYLKSCSMISFWFPKTSICPITLFELGKVLGTYDLHNVIVLVGCDPEYSRLFDVQQQSKLEGVSVIIGKEQFFKAVKESIQKIPSPF